MSCPAHQGKGARKLSLRVPCQPLVPQSRTVSVLGLEHQCLHTTGNRLDVEAQLAAVRRFVTAKQAAIMCFVRAEQAAAVCFVIVKHTTVGLLLHSRAGSSLEPCRSSPFALLQQSRKQPCALPQQNKQQSCALTHHTQGIGRKISSFCDIASAAAAFAQHDRVLR